MNIFHEDGRGNIVDESGKEAPAFLVDPSFRLTNLTNLQKYIKNAKLVAEIEPPKDTVTVNILFNTCGHTRKL